MPKGCTFRVVVDSATDLGELIRQRRKALKVKQAEFGAVVGVGWDQTTVSRYERGRIPLSAANDVARVLKGLTRDQVEAILKGEATNPPGFEDRLNAVEFRLTAVERHLGLPVDYTSALAEVRGMTAEATEVGLAELDAAGSPRSPAAKPGARSSRSPAR